MRSDFEKHYLSLEFYTEGSAQLCLDSCSFDEKQDAYLPNMDWILENDEDECVIYCCMLNTAYLSFKHQQSKVNEMQKQRDSFIKAYEIEIDKSDELQKRIDAALKLTKSIKAENDLWGCDQVERQIELLEQALNGERL